MSFSLDGPGADARWQQYEHIAGVVTANRPTHFPDVPDFKSNVNLHGVEKRRHVSCLVRSLLQHLVMDMRHWGISILHELQEFLPGVTMMQQQALVKHRDAGERLQSVLSRYKAGEIAESQAKLEQAILQSMLKAIEQTELETRLEKLETVLRSRR